MSMEREEREGVRGRYAKKERKRGKRGSEIKR